MRRRFALMAAWLLVVSGGVGCGQKPDDVRPTPPASAAVEVVPSEEFLALMNSGRNHLEQGNATNALAVYRKAAALVPGDLDVRLNLANTHLLAGAAKEAIVESAEALRLDPNSAAAYFIQGCAHLRLGEPEAAVKAFENVLRIDPGETATFFQMGRARMELRQWNEAIAAFKEGLALEPNRLHASAHYLLGQSLLRAGRAEEARQELEQHQASVEAEGIKASLATFERSKYTRARVPFRLEQPEAESVPIRFVDATLETLGPGARDLRGPVGVIDPERSGWNGLFVREPGGGFRWFWNSNGTFHARGPALPSSPMATASYDTVLVGDLQNDRFDDVVVLGSQGSHLFQFGTNGTVLDVSAASQLQGLHATEGALMDLDFTGKLDLVAVDAVAGKVRILRQSGPLIFRDVTEASGLSNRTEGTRSVLVEDWNGDGAGDVIAVRGTGAPQLWEKPRGAKLVPREPASWVAGSVAVSSDFDNDLRPDLAILGEGKITLALGGGAIREIALTGTAGVRRLVAFDHDQDGWLDLWVLGDSLRVWRNLGLRGFQEQTAELGLDQFEGGPVSSLHVADFDMDCDSDLVVVLANGGLRYLRNDGGNAHGLVKVQLTGNRSNASGLGCKVEIETGGLRLIRTVRQGPIEIGVGKHERLDSFLVHWFNWPQGSAGQPVNCQEPILAIEATLQEGSCPYLYAWDGHRFRFVTDILGASPLGLPVAEGRMIEADPEELVRIGDETNFAPREGKYLLGITEELREVLYLDQARLVVVDRAPGVEVQSMDKLLPGGPFPAGGLMTLLREQSLRHAATLEGQEVTPALREVDEVRVSPPRLRAPQLRGLAEPHGWVLDFGPLDPRKPLVLVMNGWLRFGGGMANIAASHDPALPFPFPQLEAEVSPGNWRKLDVVVGAPAGKTKTLVVDLAGRLPEGAGRLRLTQAFEIHWDRIALLEKQTPTEAPIRVTRLDPSRAELQFHGFGRLEKRPPDAPPTPVYHPADPNSPWTILPEGWCTRYGDVTELVSARDEGLVLVNSGDELRLEFSAAALPAKPAGWVREFFLEIDGWDKDSDFHVVTGTTVEPLPFHGMNAQRYGVESRPPFASDELHRRYNTRWVSGSALRRTAGR